MLKLKYPPFGTELSLGHVLTAFPNATAVDLSGGSWQQVDQQLALSAMMAAMPRLQQLNLSRN